MNFIQEVLNLLERKQDKKTLDLKRDWFEFGRTKPSSVGNPLYAPKMTPHAIKFSDLKCQIIKGLVQGIGTQYTLPMWGDVDANNCNVQNIVDSVFSQDAAGTQGVVSADFLVTGNTVLEGNLLVLGTQTIVESTVTQVADNIFQINSGGAGVDAGFEVVVPAGTLSLVFSNALQLWTVGNQSFQAYNLNATNNVYAQGNVIAINNVQAGVNVTAGLDVIANNDVVAGNNATVTNTLSVGVDAFIDNDVVIGHSIKLDSQQITNITSEVEGLNAEDNDNSLPTTAAVKDYVDAVSLTVVGDTGVESVNLHTEQLAIVGGVNINTTAQPNDTVIVRLNDNIQLNSVNSNDVIVNNELFLIDHSITNVTTAAEGLATGNDNSLPTAQAVKDYVDANESYISNVQLNGNSLDFTGVASGFTGSIDLSGYANQGPVLGLLVDTGAVLIENQIGSSPAVATISASGGVYTIDFNTSFPTHRYICSITTGKFSAGVDILSQSQTQLVFRPLEIGTGNPVTPLLHITIHL